MFHNYFFLKRLARSLNVSLVGLELLECFSQNKDELICGFASPSKTIYLRANLSPQVGLIQISDDFKRAKRNSVDLFTDQIGKKVLKVFPFRFERSFFIELEGQTEIIFKMHGSRSNILISDEDKVSKLFRKVLKADLELTPSEMDKHLNLSYEQFEKVEGNPLKYLPALGKEVRKHLGDQGYPDLTINDKWTLMQQVLKELETNPITIYSIDDLPALSLLSLDSPVILSTSNPIEAANEFHIQFTKNHYLAFEKNKVRKPLEDQIKKTENYLEKTNQKLEDVKTQRGYDEIANILMANLHQISKGATEVSLLDFYSNETIKIKLNPLLSPQKNAENLYRKSKNQQIEINKLEENLKNRASKLKQLKKELESLESSESIKDIRAQQPQKKSSRQDKPLPYHEYNFGGYQVMVGRNSKANDELTLKVANKDDLWLHAKDVPGSHVVIRHQAGKAIPKDVLEKAAELAAWFSKRKTDTLCPVIYTPKKFIRKRKGDPAGAVVVEKEDVILVEPKNHLN
ncbi:MAG: NFACT RNA binding domain-containing protein [Marinoscillum sp.]